MDTNVGRICARLGWIPLDAEQAGPALAPVLLVPAPPQVSWGAAWCMRRKCCAHRHCKASADALGSPALCAAHFNIVGTRQPARTVAGEANRTMKCLELMACCAVPCCAMLCHAVPCCAVQAVEDLDDYAPEPEVHKYLHSRWALRCRPRISRGNCGEGVDAAAAPLGPTASGQLLLLPGSPLAAGATAAVAAAAAAAGKVWLSTGEGMGWAPRAWDRLFINPQPEQMQAGCAAPQRSLV